MSVTKKSWGTTRTLFKSPDVSVEKIEVKPNMQCSIHFHENKYNCFFVVSGTLVIEFFQNRSYFDEDDDPKLELVETAVLQKGNFLKVPPNRIHRFRSCGKVVALEIYFPKFDSKLCPKDIVRYTEGGCIEN